MYCLCSVTDRKYSVIQCTGYLKSWAPAKIGLEESEVEGDGEACNLSCLVAVGRVQPQIAAPLSPNFTRNGCCRQPSIRSIQFISRHAMDGKFLFVDQRSLSNMTYLNFFVHFYLFYLFHFLLFIVVLILLAIFFTTWFFSISIFSLFLIFCSSGFFSLLISSIFSSCHVLLWVPVIHGNSQFIFFIHNKSFASVHVLFFLFSPINIKCYRAALLKAQH